MLAVELLFGRPLHGMGEVVVVDQRDDILHNIIAIECKD